MTHKLKNELLEFAEGPFGYEGERPWQSRGEHLMEKLYWHAELTSLLVSNMCTIQMICL